MIVLKVFLLAFIAYLLVCFCISLSDYLKYRKTRVPTDQDTEYVYSVYSAAEIAADPSLADVKLYYFPAPSGEVTPYAIYLPGGSYTSCDPYDVCIPAAADANAMGYSAFVLTYRVGDYGSDFMPLDDLAAGIEFITGNASALKVEPENYMLAGFSAGGHLAGLFANERLGYGKYGVNRPSALSLGYPVVNITGGLFESGNIVTDCVRFSFKRHCINFMLGKGRKRAEAEVLDLSGSVDAHYPKTFIVQGDADFLVPAEHNADQLAAALRTAGIEYVYRLFPGITHGFGIGAGSAAEGWNREAIRFWQAP